MTTRTDPVLGWRVWHVDRGGELLSWSRDAAWPAAERMEARCRRSHEAPAFGHHCGLYALRAREQLEPLLGAVPRRPGDGRLPLAVGRASLWGRVMENVDGWRAQYGYPYDLVLAGGDRRLAAELRDRYAVDVTQD